MSSPSKPARYYIPTLQRISQQEAESISNMFRLYDYNAKGKIPKHLAIKLMKALGFLSTTGSGMPADLSLKEFLLYLDQRAPEKEPAVEAGLYTFTRLASATTSSGDDDDIGGAATNDEKDSKAAAKSGSHHNHNHQNHHPVITPSSISQFYESIGRPAVPTSVSTKVLTSMLEYDDCSLIPEVELERFSKDLTFYIKKHNVLRDFR